MLYNNIVFLSDNLELSCEKPQNLLGLFQLQIKC